jgi:hypothetical protein
VIVLAVLGHASPAFTLAVYQHAWQDGPREAALALEAALGPRLSGVGNPWQIRSWSRPETGASRQSSR